MEAILIIIGISFLISFLAYIISLWMKPIEKSKDETKQINQYDDFNIEYMPLSGRYYPKYKGRYLYYWNSGKWELSDIYYAKYADSKKGAIRIFEQYLEGIGVTSIIIKP